MFPGDAAASLSIPLRESLIYRAELLLFLLFLRFSKQCLLPAVWSCCHGSLGNRKEWSSCRGPTCSSGPEERKWRPSGSALTTFESKFNEDRSVLSFDDNVNQPHVRLYQISLRPSKQRVSAGLIWYFETVVHIDFPLSRT